VTRIKSLRELFPIRDGEIFSREKIATGLEHFVNCMANLGYIHSTSVPDTQFDEEGKRIALRIEIDEGKPYSVGAIAVVGLDEAARQNPSTSFHLRLVNLIAAGFGICRGQKPFRKLRCARAAKCNRLLTMTDQHKLC